MTEITRVHLENEMDLILAHKQTMKLGELCGLSLPTQTTLATAVSELGRGALESGCQAVLLLFAPDRADLLRNITVQIKLEGNCNFSEQNDGFRYARKLMRTIRLLRSGTESCAEFTCAIPGSIRIDAEITDRWRRYLNSDPTVSPYEEIKRKNRQLQEFASRLGESEQQYRDLTNSLPVIIYTVDAAGNLLYGNKWLHDYSGSSLQEISEQRWSGLVAPEACESVIQNHLKLASGDYTRELEYRLRDHKTGIYRWHTGSITPVNDEAGEARYWSVFLADIHAQKEVAAMLKDNDELRQTKALLEQKVAALDISNKMLEQFAYVASHDLQEPLRKIMYFSDFLLTQHTHNLDPHIRDILGRMGSATERMKLLVSDVLAYSMLPSENHSWERVSLNFVAREVMQNLELQISEKQAQVHWDRLPEIDGNQVQLRQLFENLVGNSLKYADAVRRPEITITAALTERHVTLEFRDNGIGFENQYVPKMFGLFQRLHGRDKYSGTGIGLSLCQKITELHAGRINAEGFPGEGALFTIKLPLAQERAAPGAESPTGLLAETPA